MKDFIFAKWGDKLLFALALAVLATGLLRVWSNPPPPVIVEAPPATIVFTQWWENDLDKNILPQLIAEFESLHEGIHVVLSYKSYEDLLLKLFDMCEDIFPGDVFALDPRWVSELEDKGIIEYASPPLLSFINLLFYNIDILREAGFVRPPKSRTEFITHARTVAGMEGNRLGLVMDNSGSRRLYDDVYSWIWSSGGQLLRDGRPQINTRPVIDSLSFLASMKEEGLLVKGNKLEDFSSGRAAFMISSSKDIRFVRERLGKTSFDISNIPLPDNHTGRSYYGSAGWALGVNSNSAHREEARLFVGFLAERAHILANNTGAILGGSLPSRDPLYSKAWDIAMAWHSSKEFPALPWMELETIFSEELDYLFAGETTPAHAASAIQRRWTERLSP